MIRGEIRNKEFAVQIPCFESLRYGNITPTDIDGFIDFQNKKFILFEAKYKGAEIQFGQKLALERLIDAIKPEIDAWLLIVEWSKENITKENKIDIAQGFVREYRWKYNWIKPQKQTSLKEAIAIIRSKK